MTLYRLCRQWREYSSGQITKDVLIHSRDLDLLKRIVQEQDNIFRRDNFYIENLDNGVYEHKGRDTDLKEKRSKMVDIKGSMINIKWDKTIHGITEIEQNGTRIGIKNSDIPKLIEELSKYNEKI
jgi:hypothetical protein